MMRSGMMRPQLKRYTNVALFLVSEDRYILIDNPETAEKLPILTNASKPNKKDIISPRSFK
jgi:hypothetical protein